MLQSLLHLLVAVIQAGLAVYAARIYLRHGRPYTLIVLVVLLGLTYDNTVLGVGRWIEHGELLAGLSLPRFVLHAFTTPLLIIAGFGAARDAGHRWANTPAWRVATWVVTAVMIVWGVVTDVVRLDLQPQTEAGVVSYGNAGAGMPVPAIVTIVALIAIGIFLWRRSNWSWLLVGAAVMLVASGLGSVSALLTNVGELTLAIALIATEMWAGRRSAVSTRSPAFTPS